MPGLALYLLGAFEAFMDGEPLTGIKTDKARALLAYLVMERDRPHRRQALAELLWPNYPENGARCSLRHAIANLRQTLEDDHNPIPFLLIEGETIQFNSNCNFRLDVKALDDLVTSSQSKSGDEDPCIDDLQAAIARYRGSFLEGFRLKDSPAFDNWSCAVRERYLQQATWILAQLVKEYERAQQYEKAINCSHRLLALEPPQENAHRQLMRLLAMNGQRAAALAQYEVCRRILKDDLGVEPAAETVEVYEKIRLGRISTPEASEEVEIELLESPDPSTGLQLFEEANASKNASLKTAANRLLSRLTGQAKEKFGKEKNHFLLLVGLSSYGNTSLIRAGLIPAISHGNTPGSEKWFILDLAPDGHSLEEAEIRGLRMAVNPLPGSKGQYFLDTRGPMRKRPFVHQDRKRLHPHRR